MRQLLAWSSSMSFTLVAERLLPLCEFCLTLKLSWSQMTPIWRCLASLRSAPLLGSRPLQASALTTRLAVSLPGLRLIALTRHSRDLGPTFGFPADRNLRMTTHVSLFQHAISFNRSWQPTHRQCLPVRLPTPDLCNAADHSCARVFMYSMCM